MAKVAQTSFSTSNFNSIDKYDAFVESIGAVFEVDRLKGRIKDFHADIKGYLIDELMLVRCHTKGQEFSRSSYKIAVDGLDHYFLQLFYRGGTQSLINDGFGDQGHLILIDASRPWRADNQDFDVLTLVLPRRILGPKLLSPDGHHGRSISMRTTEGKILTEYIKSLADQLEDLEEEEVRSRLKRIISIVAATLNSYDTKEYSQLSYDQEGLEIKVAREIAKRFIDLNLHEVSLNIDFIAAHINKPRAQLVEYFRPDGGIANYIQTRRLEIAYRKVTQTTESIARIAHSLGHKNEISFCRSFKKYFGRNPKDTRQKTLEASMTGQSRLYKDQWGMWLKKL